MTLVDIKAFEQARKYVEAAADLGSRPGLDRIRRLCELLGNPQDDLEFIHVAGTNGKGSTAAMIESILCCAGMRVGMYYSPAITGICDHFRVNGETIDMTDYTETVAEVAEANSKLKRESPDGATQFEIETAVAFLYFRKKSCDIVILECGMGGKEDATNVVKNKLCCVITSVGFDHMYHLGHTLKQIAAHKAGIITTDCPVIALDSKEEVLNVIRKRCETTGSTLYPVSAAVREDYELFPLGQAMSFDGMSNVAVSLAGAYQTENVPLAVKAVRVLAANDALDGCVIDEDVIREGLKKTKWPYRFECICPDPPVIVDGAHNIDAAIALSKTITECLGNRSVILIIGIFADKEYEKIVATLSDVVCEMITVSTKVKGRSLSAARLAVCAEKYCSDVTTCKNLKEAYKTAICHANNISENGGSPVVVACGSLSYLAEFTNIVLDNMQQSAACH